jgi:hypothetical protein
MDNNIGSLGETWNSEKMQSKAWKYYIDYLKKCNVILSDVEDELLWSLNPSRRYEPKIGYKDLASKGNNQPLT